MKWLYQRLKKDGKGQSFVELGIVAGVLLMMLVGMIEFGNLLNQYINVVDGAREGARTGSNLEPFDRTDPLHFTISEKFFTDIDTIIEGRLDPVTGAVILDANGKATNSAITPILLNPATDDVVITFYGVTGGDVVILPEDQDTPDPYPYFWNKYNHIDPVSGDLEANHGPQFSDTDVATIIGQQVPVGSNPSPDTGVLIVEIFYAYYQILDLPIFTTVVPNPIELHTYAIMPLSAAAPTPVP